MASRPSCRQSTTTKDRLEAETAEGTEPEKGKSRVLLALARASACRQAKEKRLKSEGRLKNTEMIVPAKAIKAESVCMETLNVKKKNYEQYMTTYKHVCVRRMNHIRKMCGALKYT